MVRTRFPGQWFQAESGLHQNWMRDYDPTTGRYLQADPLGLVDGGETLRQILGGLIQGTLGKFRILLVEIGAKSSMIDFQPTIYVYMFLFLPFLIFWVTVLLFLPRAGKTRQICLFIGSILAIVAFIGIGRWLRQSGYKDLFAPAMMALTINITLIIMTARISRK